LVHRCFSRQGNPTSIERSRGQYSSNHAYPVVTLNDRAYAGNVMHMDIHQRDDLAFPHSLSEFQRLCQDGEACARYLLKLRWRNGFVDAPSLQERVQAGGIAGQNSTRRVVVRH